MNGLHLLTISAAMSALLIFAAAEADSQRGPAGGPRSMPRLPRDRDVIIIEREVIRTVEREPEAKQDVPPPATPAAVPESRTPYVIGRTYNSIPSGCMKLIKDGASYYHCNGEWYQSVGRGNGARYMAVRGPEGFGK
jgi:hypothetical protein